MSYLRMVEFEEEGGLFHDDYSEGKNKSIANHIVKTFKESKVFCPLPPCDVFEIDEEEIKNLSDLDGDTLYVFVAKECKIKTKRFVFAYGTDIQRVCFYKVENIIIINPKFYKNINRAELLCTIDELNVKRRNYLICGITDMLVANKKQKIEDFKLELATLKSNSEHYKRQFLDAARKIETTCTAIYSLENNILEQCNSIDIACDIEEIKKSPLIKNISLGDQDDEIIFETNLIKITDINGLVHPIGEFEVHVCINNASVKFFNVNNYIDMTAKSNYGCIHHPHVDETGTPCLGNLAEPLVDVCQQGNIVQLWELLASYLQSYNPEDIWGRRLKYWRTEEGEMVNVVEAKKCYMCGTEIFDDDDDYAVCDTCGSPICDDCAIHVDNTCYCKNCAEEHYCAYCDEYHDESVQMYTCAECGALVCEDAIWNNDFVFCSEACSDRYFESGNEDYVDEEDDF